jgi:hypothetical protein
VGLFAEKAKYITADTAYFVMADPQMLVFRGVGLGTQSDIEVPWKRSNAPRGAFVVLGDESRHPCPLGGRHSKTAHVQSCPGRPS